MFEFLTLPERTTKPRESGLTHVLDKGYSLDQVRQFLEVSKDYVDIVKLGWGTAAVTPNVKEKIALYQSFGIPVCFGGTFFEVCLRQNKLEEYVQLVRDCGMTCVEISDGTIDIAEEDKLAMLRRFAKEFKVLSEVGSKDANVVIAPFKWVDSIKRELEAGAWKVITEGRESGTVGIYQPSGEVKEGLLDEIRSAVDPAQLLFEAPVKSQQAWFIKEFGANVNLGNIPPEEVISVETLRVGVRGDTLLHFHRACRRARPCAPETAPWSRDDLPHPPRRDRLEPRAGALPGLGRGRSQRDGPRPGARPGSRVQWARPRAHRLQPPVARPRDRRAHRRRARRRYPAGP